jgi:hypothetical protein
MPKEPRRKPSIGDLLILAGTAINNPEEFAHEAAHASKQEARIFLKELIDKTFGEEAPPPKKKR